MKAIVAGVLGWWVDVAQRHPRKVLLAAAVLAVLAGLAAWRSAAIDSDLGKLIRPSESLRWYRDDQQFKAAFPEFQQMAVVVVSGADGRRVDDAARLLAEALRRRPEIDLVYAPTTGDFLRRHRLYYLDLDTLELWIQGLEVDYGALLRLADSAGLGNAALTFADLVSADSGLPLPTPLASLAASFAGGPPFQVRLDTFPRLEDAAADRHYALLQLKGVQRHDQALPGAELVAVLRETVADVAPGGVDVRLTGEVVLAHEEIGAALQGIGIAGTVSIVLLALILGFGVRSLRIIVGIFLLLGLGTVMTLGFAAVTVGTFNTLALMFVVMFFGLGVDFAVHFALRVHEARAAGVADRLATVTAARDVGPALVLCMLTSSIAFLSFVPTAYRGLAELGIISAGGMVVALALTLTVIPALFGWFGLPAGSGGVARGARGLAALPAGTVLITVALLAVGAAWWARDMRFDYSVLALRDAETEGMSTLLELQRRDLTTDYSIYVLANDLDEARSLKKRLSDLPEVASVATPLDWIPGAQSEKQQRLGAAAALIDTIDAVQPAQLDATFAEALQYLAEVADSVPADRRADYRALTAGLEAVAAEPAERERLNGQLQRELENGLATLRDMLEAQPFGLDDLPAPIRQRIRTADGRYLLTVEPEGSLETRAAMQAFITAVAAVAPNIAGRAVVEWGVGNVVVAAFLEAAGWAVAGIALVLIVYFRSLRLAVLVLVPLLLATLFTLALAALGGMTLNMANILVVPLIFGLGVDTGIHVVHRFVRGGGIEAVFASSTARAVVISALTTIGTFFSLSFSPHKGAASVGLLLSLAISLMLLVTYLVLPALLRYLAPVPDRADA